MGLARRLLVYMVGAAIVILAVPAPAGADFIGGNGRVVFVRSADGDNDIYMVESTGTNPVDLTNDDFDELARHGRLQER